jgi:uncharacterized protein YpmB
MNINLLKQKKVFKKKDYKLNPNLSWSIIVFLIFIAIVLSFVYGFFLFMKINKDVAISNVDTITHVEESRKIRIEKVLEYFSEREKKSEEILVSPSLAVDPSI